jgi:hypothetical protein
MTLLEDVVQVFALPQPAASSDYAFLFELIDGHRVSAVLIYVDYPRASGCPNSPTLCERSVSLPLHRVWRSTGNQLSAHPNRRPDIETALSA